MIILRIHPDHSFQFIAHRGASYDAPENTLAAVTRAWEVGADAVEVDVRLSQDGQIVLMHDKTTRRTGHISINVEKSNYARLNTIDVGKWKYNDFINEKIPLLSDILKTIPSSKTLYIELKSGKRILKPLVELLHSMPKHQSTVSVIAMNLDLLIEFQKDCPGIPLYWVHELDYYVHHKIIKPSIEKIIQRAQTAGLSGVDLWAGKMITPRLVRRVHEAGLKLLLWTVDNPRRAAEFINMGVDGITTNRPGWLKSQIGVK